MSEIDVTFDHASTFAAGEVTGNLQLGKLEATYGEIFSDAIEDGVITPEEREELERTAKALGLDRDRLAALEAALQAVYEERHRVKIVEVPAGPVSTGDRASIALEAPDARSAALTARVRELEARVRELEAELAEARAHVAVEVDLSGVEANEVAEDPVPLQRRLTHDARDVETLHALYRIYDKQADTDRRWCVAHALAFLGAANEKEQAAFVAHRTAGLIKPATSLTPEAWRRLLFHPDEEALTGEIFSVIVSPVLLGRVAALRRDKALPALDPAKKQDPAQSTLQGVRCFSWAAAILGMRPPTLFADPTYQGLVEMVPNVPPATRLGRQALSGRSPLELAFVAGRHLAWYREERFVRMLVPNIPDLEDLFLCAILIANPGIPLKPDTKRRVQSLASAIEPILEPRQIDRLRAYFLRFVEEGGRTNLQRWASAADFTAARAGLLLCNDLRAAAAMLEMEDAGAAKERIDDLLVFLTSDRGANLRKQIGIAAQ